MPVILRSWDYRVIDLDNAARLVVYKGNKSIPNAEAVNDMAQVYSPDRHVLM